MYREEEEYSAQGQPRACPFAYIFYYTLENGGHRCHSFRFPAYKTACSAGLRPMTPMSWRCHALGEVSYSVFLSTPAERDFALDFIAEWGNLL